MGWDGMYPQHNCKVCGKPLNADGGHPSELYAGTYTSLCDICTRLPAYVVKVYRDGASKISYAPNCPSHRRDRVEYIGYTDCSVCSGTGRLYQSRADSSGGSYYKHCRACSDRFYHDKLRKWYSDRQSVLLSVVRDRFELSAKKLKLKGKKLDQWVIDNPGEWCEWGEVYRAKLEELTARFECLAASKPIWD